MTPGQLLGPQGVAERMAEIQRRIEAFSPPPQLAVGAPSFSDTLGGLMPANPSDFSGQATPELSNMANAAALKYGIDPSIFSALVQTESNWNPAALSGKGAAGLTQLMPDTAAQMGVKDSQDPFQSLDGGAHYLRKMLDRFGNDYPKALAAYNAGPGAVDKAGGMPPYQETIAYVRKIMAAAGKQ